MPRLDRFNHFRKLHLQDIASQARYFLGGEFATNRGEHALLDFVFAAAV
jgi:hypothetical protein